MLQELETDTVYACDQCALPCNQPSTTCGRCLTEQPAFCRSVIPYRYALPLDYLIGRFKFEHCLASAHFLGQQFQQQLRLQNASADVIVPVPMHWRGLLKRGFDQTLWLAQAAGRASQAPVRTDLLHKIAHSPALHGLNRKDRMLAIRGVYKAEPVAGLHVALVDDIVTTTTTVRALSKLLVKAGAASIQIWALARTPEH